MNNNYWLMKSEPDVYGIDTLQAHGKTIWDGVRNHRAAMNLRTMQAGDQAFFYHSVTGKEIVGITEITVAGLTDPKDPDGKWPAVKLRPLCKFNRPVTLAEIKADATLDGIELVRLSRRGSGWPRGVR